MSPPQKGSFRIAQVRSVEAAEAFAFHKTKAKSDSHIWPRTTEQLQQYIDDGCLFGIWRENPNEFVAQAYMMLEDSVWEFGGLLVDGAVRNFGIGSILSRFALAHTMVYEAVVIN